MLRNHISTHCSGDEINDASISLAASDTARKFHSSFVSPHTRGQSENNNKLVAGNVFHNCKGQPYLALLLPFQKKSNTFFKKKEFQLQHSLSLIPIELVPEKIL